MRGCSKDCPECYNQDFRKKRKVDAYSISSLYEMVMTHRKEISGVTFSGGEPFDQAEGLYYLALHLKEAGLNIMCYSGYTLNELQNNSDSNCKNLLGEIDILIDGPYIKNLNEPSMWKGSSNQNVYFFNKSLSVNEQHINSEIEIMIEEDGSLSISGTFRDRYMAQLLLDLT